MKRRDLVFKLKHSNLISDIGLSYLGPFLYLADFDELDYNAARKFLKGRFSGNLGCSAFRSGNIFARNLDFFYNNAVEFVVRTQNSNGRFATLGVASNIPELLKQNLSTRTNLHNLQYAPFTLVDGINDHGVFMCVNVVPSNTFGSTTGTHPGNEEIYTSMLVRYILDHFASADEAKSAIENTLNIVNIQTPALNYEYHYLLGDGSHTYIVEFIDNVAEITEVGASEMPAILTNFYNHGVSLTEQGEVDYTTVSDYGQGLERYNILNAGISAVTIDGGSSGETGISVIDGGTATLVGTTIAVTNLQKALELLESVKYSKAYLESTDPLWLTEFTGEHASGNLTVTDAYETPSKFDTILAEARTRYSNRHLNGEQGRNPDSPYFGTWITTHSSVYDLEQKSLSIKSQEGSQLIEIHLFRGI